MGRQMKAEREKRAVILEAEGMRQADITRAEGRKAAVVLEAEGRKEAAFRDAEARERSAQAEAAATRMVSEAIAQGDIAALNYLIADKYVRAFTALAQAPNQKVHRADGARLARRHARRHRADRGGALRAKRAPRRPRVFVARSFPTACARGGSGVSEIGLSSTMSWLVAGLALCAAETLVPGAFLIWIGAAAVILGAVEFFPPMALTLQLLVFAALVVGLLFVGRRVYGSLDAGAPPLPMSRAHALIGKEFFLDEAIVRGFGRIRVGDSVWRVAGEDLPTGTGAGRGDRRRFVGQGGEGMSREFPRPTQGV